MAGELEVGEAYIESHYRVYQVLRRWNHRGTEVKALGLIGVESNVGQPLGSLLNGRYRSHNQKSIPTPSNDSHSIQR